MLAKLTLDTRLSSLPALSSTHRRRYSVSPDTDDEGGPSHVDHHYRDDEMELDVVLEDDRGDGMELDIVLGAQGWDDDGRSDGGSAWAPSDGPRSGQH
jgi:hypothetical protein